MARLAYYASRIADDKPNWLETPEGFRIYTRVPICRTGTQEYFARELKKHPDFKPEWGLHDNDVMVLHRPLEVVTAARTIASFEGKSVTDEHPPSDDALVFVDNEEKYGRGHQQNVRVGDALPDGETPLIADLFVKNTELNGKIDSGIRDVSCGYTFRFERTEDGRFVMTEIVGNHIAVVPRGRAGSEIAIRDSVPVVSPDSIRNNPDKKRKEPMKKGSILGRMLKAFAADADPEEVAEAAKLVDKSTKDAEAEDDKDEKKKAAEDKSAKDAEAESRGKLMTACDKLTAAVDALTAKLSAKDDAKDGDEKPAKNESANDDANVLELEGDEKGKSVLPKQIGDAAALLKPMIAASKNSAAADAFRVLLEAAKGITPAEDAGNVYEDLASLAAVDSQPAEHVDPMTFFQGVNYAEGHARYMQYLANQKAKKGNK